MSYDDVELVEEISAQHNLASCNLLNLYDKLSLLLEENSIKSKSIPRKVGDFEVCGSGVGGGEIEFGITVPKEDPMPEFISDLFFSQIDSKFVVDYYESDAYKERNERNFRFAIKEAS